MSGKDTFSEITGVFQDLNDVSKEKLRGGKGSMPRGPQKRRPNKSDKGKSLKPTKPTSPAQERRYQAIRLAKSGRSLKEIQAFMKTGSTLLERDFANEKDLNTLSTLEYGLERFLLTRGQSKELMRLRFGPRKKNNPNRQEVLAEFAIGGRIPLSWEREPHLRRKPGRPPAPSRPGTAKKIVSRTKVVGAERVLRDFKALIRSIQKLVGPKRTAALKELRGAAKAIRANAKLKT